MKNIMIGVVVAAVVGISVFLYFAKDAERKASVLYRVEPPYKVIWCGPEAVLLRDIAVLLLSFDDKTLARIGYEQTIAAQQLLLDAGYTRRPQGEQE